MNQYSQDNISYSNIQLKLVYYHFLVLSTIYIFKTNQFEFSRLKILAQEKCLNYVMNIRKVKQILNIMDKILMLYHNYNLIVIFQKIFRLVDTTLTSISKFMEIDLNYQAPRLGSLIYIKFFFIFSLIGNVTSSLMLLRDKLMFDFQKVVALPVRIKLSICKCRNEIRNFWLQIEQIFLILRLPIEFLSLIGRFLHNLISFLSSIEKPKVPKI